MIASLNGKKWVLNESTYAQDSGKVSWLKIHVHVLGFSLNLAHKVLYIANTPMHLNTPVHNSTSCARRWQSLLVHAILHDIIHAYNTMTIFPCYTERGFRMNTITCNFLSIPWKLKNFQDVLCDEIVYILPLHQVLHLQYTYNKITVRIMLQKKPQNNRLIWYMNAMNCCMNVKQVFMHMFTPFKISISIKVMELNEKRTKSC